MFTHFSKFGETNFHSNMEHCEQSQCDACNCLPCSRILSSASLWARFRLNASSQVRLTPAGASRPARRGRRAGPVPPGGARWARPRVPSWCGQSGALRGPGPLGCSRGGRSVGCDQRSLGFRFRKALREAAWLCSAQLPRSYALSVYCVPTRPTPSEGLSWQQRAYRVQGTGCQPAS